MEVIVINPITRYREQESKTQEDVAVLTGFSRQYISLLESGDRGKKLPVPTAKRIASALGFDWQEFYRDDTGDAVSEV
jgi:transcriptional regulator with XRE-family HTH domain